MLSTKRYTSSNNATCSSPHRPIHFEQFNHGRYFALFPSESSASHSLLPLMAPQASFGWPLQSAPTTAITRIDMLRENCAIAAYRSTAHLRGMGSQIATDYLLP